MGRVYHQRLYNPNFQVITTSRHIIISLFAGMEIDGKDPGLGCNGVDYGKGYTLVVFDLSSEVTDAAVQTVKKTREFTA